MAFDDKLTVCSQCGNESATADPPRETCYKCGGKLINYPITLEEEFLIKRTSKDDEFFQAMVKLRETDIIEYQSRISQFRAQAKAEGCYDKPKQDNRPKCPKCGSTSITAGARGVSGFWGFIGANKTVNRCANCGYTWKPGR